MTRISITENDIKDGNISNVAKVVDTLAQQPDQTKCEGVINLDFASMTVYTMAQRFSQPEYRSWFKKLDRECNNILFYLSDESMLPYLMGNIDFSIDAGHKMTFDKDSAIAYIRGKKRSIASFCLGNNIDPKESMKRLMAMIETPAETSPQPQRTDEEPESGSTSSKADAFFSKFPYSARTTMKDGEMRILLNLYLDNMPGGASILGIYFVSRNVPQPHFCVVCGNSDMIRSFDCVLLSSENDFTQCLARKNGVTCLFCIRDELDKMECFEQDYNYEIKQLTRQEADKQIELLKQNLAQKKTAGGDTAMQPEATASQQEISEAMLGFDPDEVQEPPKKPETTMPEPPTEPAPEAAEPVYEPRQDTEKPAETPVMPADEAMARMERRISELERTVKQLTESNSLYLNELTRIQKKLDDIGFKQFFKLLYQKFFK